jgi:hypothetical protein
MLRELQLILEKVICGADGGMRFIVRVSEDKLRMRNRDWIKSSVLIFMCVRLSSRGRFFMAAGRGGGLD